VAAVALAQSSLMAVQFMLPVIARKQFGAGEWQTLIITAAPVILYSLSIFWNDLFGRMLFGRYLLVFWFVTCAPLALVGLADTYWGMAIPFLLSCIGGAGYPPAAGELFRALYPEKRRGRIYSIVWGASLLFTALAARLVGAWLNRDPDAFRIYMPVAAGLQLVGVGIFVGLSHASGHASRRAEQVRIAAARPGGLARIVEPVAHMREILAKDPVFFRYESAYMTYGIGWMICTALLPALVTDKLHLPYDAISESTQVAYLVAMVCMLYPAGLLMDRLGAVRSTGLSFGLLTLYPLALMWASNTRDLTIASLLYGIAHAGASVGWMLGPVSLAPTPDMVSKYVAIHATLVGIRGKLFQALGVGLYALFHDFRIPLALAAIGFLWSSIQMMQLNRRLKPPGAPAPER
jgi:MFS family permease